LGTASDKGQFIASSGSFHLYRGVLRYDTAVSLDGRVQDPPLRGFLFKHRF